MKIAVYSRKSKFTGKGESIENQIQLCKEYIKGHFDIADEDISIYEDEGFSGGNSDRPQFQMMLKDAKNKKFSILICYRLDRVSRNISDFSSLIDELQKSNISFISIREQFDTSSPMGRAMMYIASVFAQLERETITERIRDNMIQLAKTGRWLGGITPLGFSSKPVVALDSKGKQRKQYKLIPVSDEQVTVKLIYKKFIELKSLTKLETFCIQNNIKTRNDINFSRFTLRTILTNPVYAVADKKLYNYYIQNGFEIYANESDFNGHKGIMAYNKTMQKKHTANKLREPSEWVIAVGIHIGLISSDEWISVQHIIRLNRTKSFRKVKNSESVLSGILKCGKCGSYMRPKFSRVDKKGNRIFYYMCELKEKSKRQKCNNKNINGNVLDKIVINEIKKLSYKDSELYNKISIDKLNIETSNNSILSEISFLEKDIKSNEQSISNLVSSISLIQDTSTMKYIINKINELDKKNKQLKGRLLHLNEKSENNKFSNSGLDIMKDMLSKFSNVIDTISVAEKRSLVRGLVEKITWDGKNIDIVMFGSGLKEIKK